MTVISCLKLNFKKRKQAPPLPLLEDFSLIPYTKMRVRLWQKGLRTCSGVPSSPLLVQSLFLRAQSKPCKRQPRAPLHQLCDESAIRIMSNAPGAFCKAAFCPRSFGRGSQEDPLTCLLGAGCVCVSVRVQHAKEGPGQAF